MAPTFWKLTPDSLRVRKLGVSNQVKKTSVYAMLYLGSVDYIVNQDQLTMECDQIGLNFVHEAMFLSRAQIFCL
jgi:hypothetical protein